MSLPHFLRAATKELTAAAACGVAGCGLLCGLDLLSLQLRPDVDPTGVVVVLCGLASVCGVVLGGGAYVAATGWRIGLNPLFDRSSLSFAAFGSIVAVVCSPFLWLLAEGTLSGGSVRQVLSPVWSVPAGAAVAGLGVGTYAALLGWLIRRAVTGQMDVAGRVLGSGALLGLCASSHWINGHAYVRLYPEIHTALCWASWSFGAGAAALWVVPAAVRSRRSGWLAAGGGLLGAAALSLFLVSPLRDSHRVRFMVVDATTFGREVVETCSVENGSGGVRPISRIAARKGDARRRAGLISRRGASVLLVTVDALRSDRLFARRRGRPLAPDLARWAKKNIVFERAYCHAPHSSYSLSSLLTGQPVKSLVALGRPLPPTVAERVRHAGYSTSAFCTRGVFYTQGEKLEPYWKGRFGFERFDPNGYDAAELTRRAISELARLRSQGVPFLLWVHYFDVHEPYRRHESHDFGSRPVDRYDSEVAYTQKHVVRLIETAEHHHPNLITVLTSDHGEEFGEHGGYYHGSSLYDEQVRVPLVVSVPRLEANTLEEPVSLLDVVPTLLELLAFQEGEGGRGKGVSLVGAMVEGSRPDRPVFAEVDTKRMVAHGSYKLILDTWRRTVELYDLERDPGERRNLADSEPNKVASLRWFLSRHLAELGRRNPELPEALAVARLGGRGGQEGLCRLVGDPDAARHFRIEAARRLGKMSGGCSSEALEAVLSDADEAVADEAALALGELRDEAARSALRSILMRTDDASLRHRAAIAAGRLEMTEAAPYLIAALSSPNDRIRYRASHYLGRVGKGEAVWALERAAEDTKARHLVAVSLGQVASRAGPKKADHAIEFLSGWIAKEKSTHVIRSLAKGLGYMANPKAIRALRPLLSRKDLPEVREALIRCGAIGRTVWGVDLGPGSREQEGVSRCRETREKLAFRFLGQTVCNLAVDEKGSSLVFPVDTPPRDRVLVIRMHLDPPEGQAAEDARARVGVNDGWAAEKPLRAGWQEVRLRVPEKAWRRGENVVTVQAEMDGAAVLGDYLVIW
jgi:arylsulfatase A-like enzyme